MTMMMTNSNWEIDEKGVTLLLLGSNGKRTNDSEKTAIESMIDTMSHGYKNFKQIIRLQELETKGNEENLEQEEDSFNRLKVENEDTVALYMRRNAAAEQEEEEEEEEPAGDVDVEDDTSEGYRDEEDAE
jgi:hypothetical protein